MLMDIWQWQLLVTWIISGCCVIIIRHFLPQIICRKSTWWNALGTAWCTALEMTFRDVVNVLPELNILNPWQLKIQKHIFTGKWQCTLFIIFILSNYWIQSLQFPQYIIYKNNYIILQKLHVTIPSTVPQISHTYICIHVFKITYANSGPED